MLFKGENQSFLSGLLESLEKVLLVAFGGSDGVGGDAVFEEALAGGGAEVTFVGECF